MQEYNFIALAGSGVFILMQVVMLGLQWAAQRRTPHFSLAVLCTASGLTILYGLLMLVPYFVPMEADRLAALLMIAMILGICAGILGLYGTAMLLRNYGRLLAAGKPPSFED